MSKMPKAITRADMFALSEAQTLDHDPIEVTPLTARLPHTHPATWEGSVRDVLRGAVDQHRELRGCALASHGLNAETGAIKVEIGADMPWATLGQIDRVSMDDVRAGCEALAAVALVSFRRDRQKPTDCPVCLGIAGWLPTCGAHRPGAAVAKPQETAPATTGPAAHQSWPQVGDRVVLHGKEAGDFTEPMEAYAGKIATVKTAISEGTVKVDIDGGHWVWYVQYLKPAPTDPRAQICNAAL